MMPRIGTWMLFMVVVPAGWAPAQDARSYYYYRNLQTAPGEQPESPAKLPETLGELIARALRSNPDVLLTQARLKAAEAELNQARLKVTQAVVTTHQQLEVTEQRLRALNKRYESGEVSEDAVLDIKQAQVQLEAELRYLVGIGANLPAPSTTSQLDPSVRQLYYGSATPRQQTADDGAATDGAPQIPEDVRTKLNTQVKCDFVDRPLTEVIQAFASASKLAFIRGPGVAETSAADSPFMSQMSKVSLSLGEVPLRSAMAAIADSYGYCFVIRDYGVLVTTTTHAMTINAPRIP